VCSSDLIELGRLAGLEPSLRAAHVGDAGGGGFGVDASDVFVDEFGLVAGGLNAGGLRDECGHGVRLSSRLPVKSNKKSQRRGRRERREMPGIRRGNAAERCNNHFWCYRQDVASYVSTDGLWSDSGLTCPLSLLYCYYFLVPIPLSAGLPVQTTSGRTTLGVITPTAGASPELFGVAYLKRPGFRMSQLSLTRMGRLRGPRVS
jgi:hypothetical protein